MVMLVRSKKKILDSWAHRLTAKIKEFLSRDGVLIKAHISGSLPPTLEDLS